MVHLTTVSADVDGDTTFPIGLLTGPDWVVEHREDHPADARHAYPHRYERLRRLARRPRPGDNGGGDPTVGPPSR